MTRPDITIRGAGIFGLSIAWAAIQRGAKVRVIETGGFLTGASGGLVGALNPHIPEKWDAKKAFQLESLLMAERWWRGVEAASDMPSGYARLGRLQPLADERAVMLAHARAQNAAALWHGAAHWHVIPAAKGAWEPPSASGYLVHDTLSARLAPRVAVVALVHAIRARGGEIVLREAAPIGPVIWATGVAGLADLGAHLGRNMGGGEKGQALSLRFDAADMPQIYVDNLHITPHFDGSVAIGSTTERTWGDATSVDEQLDALHARAVAALPCLAGAEVLSRWAGLRPRSHNRAPILGAWPGRAGHFVANGGFKIGFGMAPKVAEVMVDLVLEGRDAIPDAFRL